MLHISHSLEQDLSVLNKKLIEYLLTKNNAANQVLEHIFSHGGKRIRPTLFLLSCQLLGYNAEHKFPIACVCEYIHTASLLHDDVIDNSTLRRNKPTVNSVWGDETAVLSGDLIYSTACRLMAKTTSLDLIDCFAECIRFMSESELFQLDLLWKHNMTYEDYSYVVEGKTASLFEASCKASGFLNRSEEPILHALSGFGKNLGFAFQIADDCLDYSASSSTVGKPVANDFLEGKVTLPLIYALEKEDSKLTYLVQKMIEVGDTSSEEKLEFVNLVHKTGGVQRALEKAREFALKSLEHLEEIKNSATLNELQMQAFENLKEMTHFALNRKN